MRDMSTADKIWLRQEMKSAVRQVLYEEFGDVLRFLKAVKEKGDISYIASLVQQDDEAEDGEGCEPDVGRETGDPPLPVSKD